MFTKRILATFFIVAICLAAALPERNFCHAALILEGQLFEHGEKLSPERIVKMTLRIYDDEFGGQLLFEEKQKIVAGSEKALFTFEKGDITVRKRTSVLDPETLWVEVESNGQIMIPRLSLAEINKINNLTSISMSFAEASLRTTGEPTLIIDNDGVTLGSLLNMDTHSINLGGILRDTWPEFSDIVGTVSDGQITDTMTRDAELAEGLDTKSDTGHLHDDRYYTKTQVDSLVTTLEARIVALETLLANVSRTGNDLYFDSMNVHVRNGTGATASNVNGLGNLIVGYNEERGSGDDRSGSHNLVVGINQNFSYYGGLLAGLHNEVSSPYASVAGGYNNTATGNNASVSGGIGNTASGNNASVSGGGGNVASGYAASVSGGGNNTVCGYAASVSGGDCNEAFGEYTAIAGGKSNLAGDPDKLDHNMGEHSTVSGGYNNTASGQYASVTGGGFNIASGSGASVAGGGGLETYCNEAYGDYTTITGGRMNVAGDPNKLDHRIGYNAVVSGGGLNTASGSGASITGGFKNTASGNLALVSGGYNNIAGGYAASVAGGGGFATADGNEAFGNFSAIVGGRANLAGDPDKLDHELGEQATIGGGIYNIACGITASVAGGINNIASGQAAVIAGGADNVASGDYASVSGGGANIADGYKSSVSGGNWRKVSGNYDWQAGSLFQDY